MTKNKVIFSIVICTFNGAKKIEPAIKSILAQNYPATQYEVIVVDDGSTDNTREVVSRYPVKLISNKKNLGIAGSRNVGLEHASGEFLACFDDDCVASVSWLRNLSKGYTDPNVVGVGSYLVHPNCSNIIDTYLSFSGYGNPAPILLGRYNTIYGRFWSYLVSNFSNSDISQLETVRVAELPGAVASYRVSILRSVGGWDNTLTDVAEDSQLSRTLRNTYTDKYFVSIRSAKLTHNHKMSLLDFLKKEYSRGNKRKDYYKRNGLTPPYFPGPILFSLLLPISLFQSHLILVMIIMPILLYPWWIYRSLYYKEPMLVMFPYIQLLHESAIVIGMI